MSGGVERGDAFAAADRLGWAIDPKPNKKGYLKMRCSCGRHITWLHKTPSNPHYYQQRVAHMERTYGGPQAAGV